MKSLRFALLRQDASLESHLTGPIPLGCAVCNSWRFVCGISELPQGPCANNRGIGNVTVYLRCTTHRWILIVFVLIPTSIPTLLCTRWTVALRELTWLIAGICLVGVWVQCRDHLPTVPADVKAQVKWRHESMHGLCACTGGALTQKERQRIWPLESLPEKYWQARACTHWTYAPTREIPAINQVMFILHSSSHKH